MEDSTSSSTEPPPSIPAHPMIVSSQWSTGLCGCCSDVSNCCVTCWCPCIPFGEIAEIVDKGTTSCGVSAVIYLMLNWTIGCTCVYTFMYRSKLRQQYMLPEEPCNDCLVHCCCESCALCQEYRELKHRGFKPSLGWHGNLANQNQGVVMPPTVPREMSR